MPVDDIEFSKHALDMLRERSISEQWVRLAIQSPDRVDVGEDSSLHYAKAIPEHGGRFLHVVVNPHTTPQRVVTVFFDRRLGRKEP